MGMARKNGRDISGILLLDKPTGVTSNKALRRVSGLLNARKAGHTGSLDPLATGLLVLCFGEATKISGWLLDADKTYETVARLGVTTDSADADGSVVSRAPVPAIEQTQLDQLTEQFTGPQQQIAPMFSALKYQGQRLHELARKGQVVERSPRDVVIHELGIEAIAPDQLALRVRCSKGTYIRSLVADIGQAIGCGAHVEQLRRTALGPFADPVMHELADLERLAAADPSALDRRLLDTDAGLIDYPLVSLNGPEAAAFRQGQRVFIGAHAGAGPIMPAGSHGVVRVHENGIGLLGVGVVEADGGLAPRRLLVQRSSQG